MSIFFYKSSESSPTLKLPVTPASEEVPQDVTSVKSEPTNTGNHTPAYEHPPQDAASVKSEPTTTDNQNDLENNRTSTTEASVNQTDDEKMLKEQLREEEAERIHEQLHPSRRMLHKMILLLSFVTCIAAVLMLTGQIMGLFIFRSYGPIQYVLHFYVFLLCIIVVLVECEFTPIGRQSFIFNYWLTRGLSYSFIGVLGLEENDNADWTNSSDFMEIIVKFVAWFMVVVGVTYFVLGLFFVQIFYTKERKDYVDRCTLAKQLRSRNSAMHPDTAVTADPVPSPQHSAAASKPNAPE